ncbi:unnamed protein product [Gongylonema pulchrum]|uniref:Rad21_Rec8 domain-containing protein n=1 Tax=Gongylonema pulchrum TaxID=637853 RepID=A0A183D865_9BILA|nr:unnamed protein product [Gongylonema pulchrum]
MEGLEFADEFVKDRLKGELFDSLQLTSLYSVSVPPSAASCVVKTLLSNGIASTYYLLLNFKIIRKRALNLLIDETLGTVDELHTPSVMSRSRISQEYIDGRQCLYMAIAVTTLQ